MWTGSPRCRQVIQRNESAPQPLGRRLTGRLCLLAGFCLLVLAVVPVAAQAVPLNYSNGAKLKESSGLFGEAGVKEVMGWGTIDLKGGTSVDLKCHNVIAGDVWNPVGGGPGKGETQASAVFDCEVSAFCAAGTVVNVVPEELPWVSELQENGLAKTAGIRSHTEHLKFDVTCNGASSAQFFGSYQPGAPAGEDKGTGAMHPGFLEFDQPGTGGLEEVGFPGEPSLHPTGIVKELGYTEQELLQAK